MKSSNKKEPIKITRQVLKSLNPCNDRWENYLNHHSEFEGTLTEFLKLENITPQDKIWVFVRLAPRFLVECFAIDCAFAASAEADKVSCAYVASTAFATAAADSVTYAAIFAAAYAAADAAVDAAVDAADAAADAAAAFAAAATANTPAANAAAAAAYDQERERAN
jgi:uncharacterized membrane protein YbaN (DUF454 family)